ncbi:MAG: DNA polymerase III subunit gamma/tau [Acidobacteria bacterium]|nr:DNA polymerase III subunit gamma/tau [Acidobacteriota bacterium]
MSYLVIARKYRPQHFADLTGQEHITRTLSYALDQARLHHAYLFSGVRGTGKTTSARILAKGLNCHTGITSQPCLKCPSCLEIAAGNSLDVLEIDAASNTGVDNVRDVIINNLAIAPARDRHKIFVIDEVHMLSNSAFNALLKTLEEPPSHVVFIMATTELHKVPDTILSRCQQFEFRHIPTDKIYQRLRTIADAEKINIPDEALREIARAGAGSLRDAQSAFDQVIAFSGGTIALDDVTASLGLVSAKTLGDFTEAIATQNTSQLLALVEEVNARGYDLRNFSRELMAYFRHLLLIKSGISTAEILGVADVEVTRLQKLAAHFSEEDLVRSFHLLAETEKEIKDAAQPRFALELGLVKLTQATRLQSLSELIEKLSALETRLLDGNGGASSPSSLPSASLPAAGKPRVNSFTTTPTAPAVASKPKAEAPTPNDWDDLNLPALPQLPKMPAALASPAPLKPAAATAAQALAPPPQWDNEPPDFPDLDLSSDGAVEDWDEPHYAARPAVRKPTVTPMASRAPVMSGEEVPAICRELETRKQHLLVTALEDAQVTYELGLLRITMASDDVWAKRLRDATATFRDIGMHLFGQPLRLELTFNSEVATLIQNEAQSRAAAHEQAKQNPAVRLLLDKFKGEIVNVRAQTASGNA